jgi:hypothetical protein
VICGDLPADYVSASEIEHPREAVRAFAERWRELARRIASGDDTADVRIGSPDDWPALSPLLGSRASLLLEWVDDDANWEHSDDPE